jgi:hypothetical protein
MKENSIFQSFYCQKVIVSTYFFGQSAKLYLYGLPLKKSRTNTLLVVSKSKDRRHSRLVILSIKGFPCRGRQPCFFVITDVKIAIYCVLIELQRSHASPACTAGSLFSLPTGYRVGIGLVPVRMWRSRMIMRRILYDSQKQGDPLSFGQSQELSLFS